METDTDKIRRLLDCFYAGEATEAEVRQISNYFSRARSLSPELETERRIFNAMHPSAGEFAPPERLTRAVSRIGRRSPLLLIARWGIAAAAVVGAVFVSVNLLDRTGGTGTDAPVFAEVQADGNKMDSVGDDGSGSVVAEDPRHICDETEAEPGGTKTVKSGTEKRSPAKRRSDLRRSVPDKKQRKAIEVSVELLNRTLSKVSLACVDAESQFEEVNNVLKEL